MYIVLNKVLEYQYPLYFENSKFELISHAWCHSIRQLLRDSKYSCNTGPC